VDSSWPPPRLLDLLDLPGVPESVLPEVLLARLPTSTPAPPWDCRVRAVVWVQRAAAPLPTSSPWAGRVLPVTLGAVVDYLDSPVGRYREVFAGPLLRRRGRPTVHVPFMAVDSLPSVHGGRAHWGLPKSLAQFEGDVGAGDVTATGQGWSLALRTARRGVRVPMLARFDDDQVAGRAEVVVRGSGRATLVHVTAAGPTLSGWVGTGTHLGMAGRGRLVVAPPRPGR
jgi:hypothetical protein